jgi:TetR/AcrR family transcriptional regulator
MAARGAAHAEAATTGGTDGVEVPASRREVRRQQRQDLARTQILDAAEEVFGREGFHDAALRDIAERAEFSVGSVYSFFAGKDDLFRQVVARRGGEFMAGMRAVLADPTGDPVDQLHRLVDAQVGFFRAHPGFARLYLRHAQLDQFSSALVEPVVVDHRTEAMASEAELFRRGQAAGRLRAGDPEALARILSGLVAAYQAVDLAGHDAGAAPDTSLELAAFHAIVDGAFVVAP